MTAGYVDRTLLASNYQNPGDVYDDSKTEGALKVLADQNDANWDYVGSLVAGGTLQPYPAFFSRQALINGNFDVWQRGTSFSNPSGTKYTVDRWYAANSVDNNVKIYQSTAVPNKTSKYSVRIEELTAVGGVNAYTTFGQKIEDYQFFAGQKVTLSGYVKCDSGCTVSPYISDGVGTYIAPVISATTWTYFSYTATINANPTQLIPTFQVNRGGISVGVGANIAQVQVNAGDQALPFQPRSFAEELALCQRYYEKSYDIGAVPGTNVGSGIYSIRSRDAVAASAAGAVRGVNIFYKARKRNDGTVTLYSVNGTSGAVRKNESATDRTGCTATNLAETGFSSINMNNSSATAIALDDVIDFHWTCDAEL